MTRAYLSFVIICMVVGIYSSSWAISYTPGQVTYGTVYDPDSHGSMSIGNGSQAYEYNLFLWYEGLVESEVAYNTFLSVISGFSLPTSLSYSLSNSNTDLLLTYTITNTLGQDINGLTLLPFLDVEIDESLNTNYNELGEKIAGLGDWEIDDPGFGLGTVVGNIYDHLYEGQLDNTISPFGPEDVSLALGLNWGHLGQGQSAVFQVMISEDGHYLTNGTTLRQWDNDPQSTTQIYFSGCPCQPQNNPVPEPATLFLLASGLVGLLAWPKKKTANPDE